MSERNRVRFSFFGRQRTFFRKTARPPSRRVVFLNFTVPLSMYEGARGNRERGERKTRVRVALNVFRFGQSRAKEKRRARFRFLFFVFRF